MPVSKRMTEKAAWVLKAFEAGEIQSRITIQKPVKVGRKYDAEIKLVPTFVKATRIPASTISRFKSGEWTPRERSIKKLSSLYDAYFYNYLRSQGLNKEDARRFRKESPERIADVTRKYKKWIKQVQENHKKAGRDVSILNITWGFAHSDHRYTEWDRIAMQSGLQKVRPSPVKRGYGHHRGG